MTGVRQQLTHLRAGGGEGAPDEVGREQLEVVSREGQLLLRL